MGGAGESRGDAGSEIRSRRHPAVRRLRLLGRERRARDDEQEILLEGIRLLEEALQAGVRFREALFSPALAGTERGRSLLAALRAGGVEPLCCEDEILEWAASTESPQGILARAERPAVAPAPLRGGELVVVLAGVQDPGNVGTIARTAEGAGATTLFLLRGCADPWGPKALRAAAGSLFRLPVATLPWQECLTGLRAAGLRLVGAEARGGQLYTEFDWTAGAALVLGSEGGGLPEEVRGGLDAAVRVPARRIESLNVAAAAAVLLFEAARRRGLPPA